MRPFDHQLEQSISLLNIERQKRELLSSIRYASYIQSALFPDNLELKKLFPKHFVFFKPRDVISGDFYWVFKRKNKVFWVVGDCTGHGVPGALMSVLGISLLSQVILNNRYNFASDILNQLREHIMQALHQTGAEGEQKDGIDLGLCIFNTENHTLQFSGAYNPLYVIRNDRLEILESDRMPIGIHWFEERSFSTREYKLQHNDNLYMFSDGFPDQFGGEKGQKLKFPLFKEMLLKMSRLTTDEQLNYANDYFYSWKGKENQVDDVLLMGVNYQIKK